MNYKRFAILLLATTIALGGCSDASEPLFREDVQSGEVDVFGQEISLEGSMTISKAGTYILSGTVEDGQLVIDVPKDEKVELILNGIDIGCSVSAPLYIKTAEKVTITLADGSVNKLMNTRSFNAIDDNNVDAVLFSKEDVDIRGDGTLYIAAKTGNGITSKDDLKIKGGSFTIDVGGHALEAKDDLEISKGGFTLKSGKDALHAENKDDATRGNINISGGTFTIEAMGDAIDASGTLYAEDCVITATAVGKGMASVGDLTIVSGTYTISSTDDSVHSKANVTVMDGSLVLTTEDDGIHADANTLIDGGMLTIDGSEGIEGMTVTVNDGEVTILASDDGINSAGGSDEDSSNRFGGKDEFRANESCDITINGGIVTIDAQGDGIDSNGSLHMNGGELYLSGPTKGGNGTLDYNGQATLTGGIVIAAGPRDMAQNFGNASTQCASLVTFANNSSGEIVVKAADGTVLASYTPTKQFATVVVSHPEFKVGESYTVVVGDQSQVITFDAAIVGGASGGFGGKPQGGGFGGGRGDQGGMPQGDMPQDGSIPDMLPDSNPPEKPQGGMMPR